MNENTSDKSAQARSTQSWVLRCSTSWDVGTNLRRRGRDLKNTNRMIWNFDAFTAMSIKWSNPGCCQHHHSFIVKGRLYVWSLFFRCACQCALLPCSLLLSMVCPPSLPRPLPVLPSMLRYICPLFSRFSAYVTHDADLFMNYHSGLPSACHQGGHSSLRNGYLPRSQARGQRWGSWSPRRHDINRFDSSTWLCLFFSIFWLCHCRRAWSPCAPCSTAGLRGAWRRRWWSRLESCLETWQGLNWYCFISSSFF